MGHLLAENQDLEKRGYKFNREFKERYFYLVGNVLYYYRVPRDSIPLGIIILENCKAEPSTADGSFDGEKCVFQLIFKQESESSLRSYELAATSEQVMM